MTNDALTRQPAPDNSAGLEAMIYLIDDNAEMDDLVPFIETAKRRIEQLTASERRDFCRLATTRLSSRGDIGALVLGRLGLERPKAAETETSAMIKHVLTDLAGVMADDGFDATGLNAWFDNLVTTEKDAAVRVDLCAIAQEYFGLTAFQVDELITPLASMGRELGIHLVLATQKPLSDSVGGSVVKANLPLRMSGVVTDAGEAYIVTGRKQSGAELLQGEGDFLVNAPGVLNPVRLQVALITDAQIARTMPRVESWGDDFGLDLDIDPGLVAGANGNGNGCEPAVDVGQLAVALATDDGINKLKSSLGIGYEKASSVRKFAVALREELARLGYSIGHSPVPHSPGVLSVAD